MSTVLETNGLSKCFGAHYAVKDVSLHVTQGSIYGLLGRNGAGKSTLMKMIIGALRPTSGEIVYQGCAWTRSSLLDVGWLIETPAVYPNLTARENLMVRARLYNTPSKNIDETIALVGLGGVGKKRVAQFSLGMKQRLGIALALVNKPSLLVLDEPTNGLDPNGIVEFRNFLKTIAGKGTTVMVSTHILSEVEQLADQIGIVAGGQLKYEGTLSSMGSLETLFMDISSGTNI